MCWWVMFPCLAWSSVLTFACTVGCCSLASSQPQFLVTSEVKPGSAYHYSQLSVQTRECYSPAEASPQVPCRIYPRSQFSHVLVSAIAQSDVALRLLQHLWEGKGKRIETGMWYN